jgi:hypothetical protein
MRKYAVSAPEVVFPAPKQLPLIPTVWVALASNAPTVAISGVHGGGGVVVSTGGGDVVGTGGGDVVSTGGGDVVSTGGGDVVSTGGGDEDWLADEEDEDGEVGGVIRVGDG